MAQEDVGQETEGQERTRGQVEPSKVCHVLQLGPTSWFPKLPPNSATTWGPSVQHMVLRGTLHIYRTARRNGVVLKHGQNGELHVVCTLKQF